MIRIICLILLVIAAMPMKNVYAAWVELSSGLDEANIVRVQAHPKNPNIIFAASERRVYESLDKGKNWKKIMGLRGNENQVRSIFIDPLEPKRIYVGTDRGVQGSSDAGKHWQIIFSGVGERSKKVFCMAVRESTPSFLYVGTAEGLFVVDLKSEHARKVKNLPSVEVYSILTGEGGIPSIAATEDGLYQSKENLENWVKVFARSQSRTGENREAQTLEQFDIEEISFKPYFSNLIFLPAQDKIYAATQKGILEGTKDGVSWKLLQSQNLPEHKINYLISSLETFYAATDRGIFKWDMTESSFKEVYEGLDSKEVSHLAYSASGDYLLAATKKGIYKYAYPELKITPPNIEHPSFDDKEFLTRFKSEPSIQQIQTAAIEYAEVHPKKIEAWRRAAMRQALLPTVSFDVDGGLDRNVDVDRGGTADIDKFITGPKDKSFDWSVSAQWDLKELIWNNDQTSIDTRSKLMAELRDDILTQVTHLYYERRRLQVEMEFASTKDLPLQIEKEIRLEELTANIDGLTGGYLSKNLGDEQGGNLEIKK